MNVDILTEQDAGQTERHQQFRSMVPLLLVLVIAVTRPFTKEVKGQSWRNPGNLELNRPDDDLLHRKSIFHRTDGHPRRYRDLEKYSRSVSARFSVMIGTI